VWSARQVRERFSLKKLNEVEGKEKYRVEVLNRFAALEDLVTELEINSAWETIRENINISDKEIVGCYELKKQKPMVRRRVLKMFRSKETS
jgi:flagellar basal body-associated protein FliL